VVLVLFDLDLKSIFKMALENEFIKEREKINLPVQPVASKPTRAGLLLPSLAVGPNRAAFPLLSHACVGRPKAAAATRFPLSSVADG
jgi:hypothetical protein